jgi:hypothetical protein
MIRRGLLVGLLAGAPAQAAEMVQPVFDAAKQ